MGATQTLAEVVVVGTGDVLSRRVQSECASGLVFQLPAFNKMGGGGDCLADSIDRSLPNRTAYSSAHSVSVRALDALPVLYFGAVYDGDEVLGFTLHLRGGNSGFHGDVGLQTARRPIPVKSGCASLAVRSVRLHLITIGDQGLWLTGQSQFVEVEPCVTDEAHGGVFSDGAVGDVVRHALSVHILEPGSALLADDSAVGLEAVGNVCDRLAESRGRGEESISAAGELIGHVGLLSVFWHALCALSVQPLFTIERNGLERLAERPVEVKAEGTAVVAVQVGVFLALEAGGGSAGFDDLALSNSLVFRNVNVVLTSVVENHLVTLTLLAGGGSLGLDAVLDGDALAGSDVVNDQRSFLHAEMSGEVVPVLALLAVLGPVHPRFQAVSVLVDGNAFFDEDVEVLSLQAAGSISHVGVL